MPFPQLSTSGIARDKLEPISTAQGEEHLENATLSRHPDFAEALLAAPVLNIEMNGVARQRLFRLPPASPHAAQDG